MSLAFFGFKKEITPKRVSLLGSPNGLPNTGPLKITQGTPLAVAENDLIENIGGHLYFTSGGVRYPLDQQVPRSYTSLGTAIKYQPVGFNLQQANSSILLLDNRLTIVATFIETSEPINGLKFLPTVTGNYTGDNNNKAGLYSYDGAGNLTLVASSANNAALWTSAAGSIQSVPFTAPYVPLPGLYFMARLYNFSAVVTNPEFAGIVLSSAGQNSVDFTFSGKLYGTVIGINDLPASTTMAAFGTTSNVHWIAPY